MKYTSVLGIAFTDSSGAQVRSFQLCFDGKSVAVADYEDGVCKRFMFADSHAEQARRWRQGFKWVACGLCYGSGKQSEYDDTWPCPPCEGKGGFMSDGFSDFQPTKEIISKS